MELLYYNQLDYTKVVQNFLKVEGYLREGNFSSADVKKIKGSPYYRARLDISNRLLFQFAKYKGESYILLLEVILNHDYSKSKFLRGATVDESKLEVVNDSKSLENNEYLPLDYINKKNKHFHILDKVVSFDDAQQEIYSLTPPLIIIGSAGSGKTIIALEKLKTLHGRGAFISLSPFLVENARNIFQKSKAFSKNYKVDFLSFKNYYQQIGLAEGREAVFTDFIKWFGRHRVASKIKDSHKLFEEFKGVITGGTIDKPYLDLDEYMGLGVRQSIFLEQERGEVYALFKKYLEYLKEKNLFDVNILSYQYLNKVVPEYDFVVIDEIQDVTNVQLTLIINSLKDKSNFILSGDSNQIVHPNFFSWSHIKTLFLTQNNIQFQQLKILKTNYRNSSTITNLSNYLLQIKTIRFGSIDRESTYLVDSNSESKGKALLLEDKKEIKQELNEKTADSTKYAILVMTNAEKKIAQQYFSTPLIFSIKEAKGLEYENIILLNFVSNNQKEFTEITKGVDRNDLDKNIQYSRGKIKEDKDLEVYKFYINSLYVAFTRTISNLYIIEKQHNHQIFDLLDLQTKSSQIGINVEKSGNEEWLKEAKKLEKHGKHEQAQKIRTKIDAQPVKTLSNLSLLSVANSLNKVDKKRFKQLFNFAVRQNDIGLIEELAKKGFHRAVMFMKEVRKERREIFKVLRTEQTPLLRNYIEKYGVDSPIDEKKNTLLMYAAKVGSLNIHNFLLQKQANPFVLNNDGRIALHYAIEGFFQNKIKRKIFKTFYLKLRPDSIKVNINKRILKFHSDTTEFFLVNALIALQDYLVSPQVGEELTISRFNHFIEVTSLLSSVYIREEEKEAPQLLSIFEHYHKDAENNRSPLFEKHYDKVFTINPLVQIVSIKG